MSFQWLLPPIKWVPSPNCSPSPIKFRNFFVHCTEGGYLGSVAWLCQPAARASANYVMKADGSEVSQLVALTDKAWAECNFNGYGPSLEIEGFAEKGFDDSTLLTAAHITVWHCRKYGIPAVWSHDGVAPGICSHHDLGAAGGGHTDIGPCGGPVWQRFMTFVEQVYAASEGLSLPPWADHGAPAPHTVSLPPAVTAATSHGGAARCSPGDVCGFHPTISGYPTGSVQDLQFRLKKVGANPALDIDGAEGDATRRAIGVFQKSAGLPVTSDMDAATWAALDKLT